MKRYLILGLMLSALAACGGGGGSDSGGGGLTGKTDYVIFYKKDITAKTETLNAYDPDATSGSGITAIPTTKLQYQTGIFDATYDPATFSASNLHIGRVLFVDNGKIESVSTAKSDGLAVIQHSKYVLKGDICNANVTNNYMVFGDTGDDLNCNGPVYAVSTNMSSSDDIIKLAQRPTSILFDGVNSIVGLISRTSGDLLVFTDEAGNNPQTLQSGVTSVSEMSNAGTSALLNVDREVKIVDASTTPVTITPTLHTSSYTLSNAVTDGSNYYFFDGQDLYLLPMDGNTQALKIVTVSTQGDIEMQYLHNNVLVYTARDSTNDTWTIASVTLTDKTAHTLVATANGSNTVLTYNGFGGDYIYYNLTKSQAGSGLPDYSGTVAGIIKADGSSGAPTEIAQAMWAGFSYSTSASIAEGFTLDSAVLDKLALDSGTGEIIGGDISIYDAASAIERNTQGSLPAGVIYFTGFGFGENLYGIYAKYDATATPQHTSYLAGLNVNTANSMSQIDMTTDLVTEYPVF